MFDNMNMGGMMKMMLDLNKKKEEMDAQLKKRVVVGKDKTGDVVICFNCGLMPEVVKIEISEAAMADKEALQKSVAEAVNSGVKDAVNLYTSSINEMIMK